MPLHSRMARAWAALICGGIAACGGGPTEPETVPAVAGPDVSEEVNALESRFLSSVEPAAARELTRALERAVVRAGRSDRDGAVQALGAARIALKVGTATPADLDALNRSLDAMLAAMEAPRQ